MSDVCLSTKGGTPSRTGVPPVQRWGTPSQSRLTYPPPVQRWGTPLSCWMGLPPLGEGWNGVPPTQVKAGWGYPSPSFWDWMALGQVMPRSVRPLAVTCMRTFSLRKNGWYCNQIPIFTSMEGGRAVAKWHLKVSNLPTFHWGGGGTLKSEVQLETSNFLFLGGGGDSFPGGGRGGGGKVALVPVWGKVALFWHSLLVHLGDFMILHMTFCETTTS